MPPPGFTMIDNAAIERASEVGPSAFQVYIDIAMHARKEKKAWPGIGRLAELTGLSARSIRYAVSRLEAAGWIVVERARGRQNTYTLPPIKSKVTSCRTPETSKATSCQGVRQPVAVGKAKNDTKVRQPVAAEEDVMKKTHKEDVVKKTKRGCAAAEVAIPSELDSEVFKEAWEGWLAYRRKRRLSCLPECLQGQLGKLKHLGPAGAVEEIKEAISNSWQSVCYKPGGNGRARKNGFPVGPGQRHAGTVGKTGVF